jgi:hypothetical protein
MLEFADEAQSVDAYNQMSARATNTRIVGMGTPDEHTSYCRVDGPGGLISAFFVDTFGIVRQGTWIAPPNQYPLWIQPTGAHDSYPVTNAAGDPARVEFEGRNYENIMGALNQFSPTAYPAGWADLGSATGVQEPDPVTYPAWAPWTSGLSEDLYQIGARVSHNGQNWEATTGNNHWEPGVFGWTVIT